VTTIAVVYLSGEGHTRVLAEAVLKGVKQVSGVSAKVFEGGQRCSRGSLQ